MGNNPVRLALIGSGIFARKAHIPALNALGKDIFKIVAVCSRRESSARSAAALIPYPVETSTDLPSLLNRDDIDAVDLVLPIGVMEEVVTQALVAGKHVISEKPIAPTVRQGHLMIAEYRANESCVWMVAENYRYKSNLLTAAQLVADGEIGRPLLATFSAFSAFTPEFSYYHTTWRRDHSFPGGLFIDASVHHIAALRLVLGEIIQVNAVGNSMRDDLPGCDTLVASLRFSNGLLGSLNVTYAPNLWGGMRFVVCAENGFLIIDEQDVVLKYPTETRVFHFQNDDGVSAELAAFAAAIHSGQPYRNTPEEALKDISVVEALLKSVDTCSPITISGSGRSVLESNLHPKKDQNT